jgi:hypothetical protein
MNEPQKIYRTSAPSLLDSAPYLSLCTIGDDLAFYIQMSKDENHPSWVYFDGDEIKAKEFIESVIKK